MLVSRPEILVHLLYSSRWCGMLQCMLPFRPEILSVFLLLNFLWLFYFRCNQDMDNCDLMGFSAFAKLNGTKPKRHKTLFLFTDERKPFCATHYRQSYRNQSLYTLMGDTVLVSHSEYPRDKPFLLTPVLRQKWWWKVVPLKLFSKLKSPYRVTCQLTRPIQPKRLVRHHFSPSFLSQNWCQ